MAWIFFHNRLFFFLFACTFTTGLLGQGVIGGQDAPPGAYPWIGGFSLKGYDLDDGQFCGATLIHPQWVLTAGHCANNVIDPSNGEVLADFFIGTYTLSDPETTSIKAAVEKVFIHERFGEAAFFDFDIALVKLSSPLSFPVVSLPDIEDKNFYNTGRACKTLGWGLRDTTNYQTADYLQEADIEIISFSYCNGPGSYNGILSENVLCAGFTEGPPAGAAAGDSGGPLIINEGGEFFQIGIVSWGQNSWTTSQYPGIYQRVTNHRVWIDSIIQANSPVVNLQQTEASKTLAMHYLKDAIQVQFNAQPTAPIEIAVYDFMGKQMFYQLSMANTLTNKIDVSNLPSGYFFCRIRYDEHFQSIKFYRD